MISGVETIGGAANVIQWIGISVLIIRYSVFLPGNWEINEEAKVLRYLGYL